MQIGVDIGGTFTDIVALDDDGRLAPHQGADHAQGPARGHRAPPSRGVLALAGAQAGRRRALHPRHHRRHQRHPRAEGRGHRGPHHRGLRGRARARAAEALAHVRPRHGPGDARRSSRPRRRRRRHPRAARRPRRGPRRRSTRRRCGAEVRAPPRRRASRPSPSATSSRSSIPPTSGARARSSPEVAPGDQRLALLRGRSDLPRVRAALRHRLRRLPRARW